MTETEFTTNIRHRINVTDAPFVRLEYERPVVIRLLFNITVNQFLADYVPATVQDLFQMVNVLDLLTM